MNAEHEQMCFVFFSRVYGMCGMDRSIYSIIYMTLFGTQ